MIDGIYSDGERYDRIFGEGPVSFWIKQAGLAGNSVLELGCGTGKLILPLASAGHSVTGLDLSAPLLQYGKEKAQRQGIVADFVEADIRDFKLSRKFDLIMLPSNNLCHLHSLEDFSRCVECVKSHLSEGGRFVIDVFVPRLDLLLKEDEYELSTYKDLISDEPVTIYAKSHYEANTQIKRTTTTEIRGSKKLTGNLDLKMYFPQELYALMVQSGFKINRFGGYQDEPFDSSAKQQIIVAWYP